MKKIILLLLIVFYAVPYSFASNNFDFSYVDASIETGYVAELNPERPFVYYRTATNGYDAGMGESAVVRTNNYPDTSTIFWSGYEGVSGAYASSSVNGTLYDRTIHSYTATYQHGEGPTQFYAGENWQKQPVIYTYGGPFGKSKTGGYFANTFQVEAGTSGLVEGTPVQIKLAYSLEGAVNGNQIGYTRTYFGSQVFDITSLQDFSFPDADRAERWSSSHNRGEMLEMYTGDNWLGLDPTIAYDNDNSWASALGSGQIEIDSEDIILNAKIGDWFFLEGYFETITELPQSGGVFTNLINIANFDNTMHFTITPGDDYSDIFLTAKTFAPSPLVTPEPVSSVLFILGSGIFAARRFKKA